MPEPASATAVVEENILAAARPSVRAPLARAFGSFKLTLSLFALLGLFAAFGSFIPQGEEAPRIAQVYGERAYALALQLGLDEVYRSWWFIMVLALMALNLIMVTWVRVPHVWRISRETDAVLLSDPLVPKTAFTRVWETPLPPLEALDRARRSFQAEFPRLAQKEGPRKRLLVGERWLVSLWAAHIVHLGLLLLLLAGVLKILFGSNQNVVIKEGQQAEVPVEQVRWGLQVRPLRLPLLGLSLPLPVVYERVLGKAAFQLYLDKFDVHYYPGTAAPSLFRSDVKVIRDGQIQQAASILVNEPLSIDGIMLYQASWGYDGLYSAQFEVQLPGEKDRLDVRAPYRQRIKLLDTGWELEVTDFYPDAQMAGPGKLVNGSDDLNNPAVRVQFWRHGVEKSLTWFVYAVPDIQMAKVPGLKLFGKTVDPVPYTVLQANADPGVDIAALGAFLVVLGVFMAFYRFYRKAWVLVEPMEGGGSRVTLAGFVRRNKFAFQRVFSRLSQSMDEGLHAGPDGAPTTQVQA
jgi:cytochrome c biogenesis protein